jgi:hypothetical protein
MAPQVLGPLKQVIDALGIEILNADQVVAGPFVHADGHGAGHPGGAAVGPV